MTTTEKIDKAVAEILALLSPFSEEHRAEIMADVGRAYCRHCGRANDPKSPRECRCWNDE